MVVDEFTEVYRGIFRQRGEIKMIDTVLKVIFYTAKLKTKILTMKIKL